MCYFINLKVFLWYCGICQITWPCEHRDGEITLTIESWLLLRGYDQVGKALNCVCMCVCVCVCVCAHARQCRLPTKNLKKSCLTLPDFFPDLFTNFPDHFRHFAKSIK